jgi:RND family efflux transporter MFP subunit
MSDDPTKRPGEPKEEVDPSRHAEGHRRAREAPANGDGQSDQGGKKDKSHDADGHYIPGQSDDDSQIELPEPATVPAGKGALVLGFGLVIVVLLFVIGFLPHIVRRGDLAVGATEAERALPRAELIKPTVLSSDRALELPGTAQSLEETTLYPRASGYVRRWLVDIGDQVKENQLLAEIETPELDAQIDQARADLANAQAMKVRSESTAALSSTERKRYETLTPAGVASGQELEQRRTQANVDESNIKVASATVASQEASLHRLLQLKVFSRVVAPFNGTVVSRSIERGALVSTGNSTPLYRIAATDPIRVFVHVPQDVTPSIHTGVTAKLVVREFPDRVFDGVVSRAAGALDDATRTMTTEVRIPNPTHALLPGMYGRVSIVLPTPHRLFEVPATALYADGDGTRLAIVDAQNLVKMRKVGIERDTGKTVEIATGLDGSERIVRIANAALRDGTEIEVIPTADKKADAPKKQ